jgi:hypothetical protein
MFFVTCKCQIKVSENIMLQSADDVELLGHNRPIPARIYAVHRFASEIRSHSLLFDF